jgi:hypothetical protein
MGGGGERQMLFANIGFVFVIIRRSLGMFLLRVAACGIRVLNYKAP